MAKLTLLGTSGSTVTKERMCAGALFEDKLIDVGFGVVANLLRSTVELDSINQVYISHTHADHIGDFTALIWAMAMDNRTKPVQVISTAKTAATLKKILQLQSTPRPFVKFDIIFSRPKAVSVETFRTIHVPENVAYRFKTGHGDLVYVGDTLRDQKVAEFAKGCDLLIHDATFLQGQESLAKITNHSTARDAAITARDAGAQRLLLTHISPSNTGSEQRYHAEAASNFEGQVIVARDNQALEV